MVTNCDLDCGVSKRLAQFRANQISDLHYNLYIVVPESSETPMHGEVTINFCLDGCHNLTLDYATSSVNAEVINANVNGATISLALRNEHIVIHGNLLRQGHNTITLPFESSNMAYHRYPDLIYTLFVPDRARYAFPCFDQPDLKARFSIRYDLPDGWIGVSNEKPGVPTLPMSTYLFGFAAGKFNVDKRHDVTFYHFPGCESQLDEAGKIISFACSWMEHYTGIVSPWPKMEWVVLPEFRFGGMEHPGCIFLRQDRLSNFNTLVHETAHLWIGDLVTMRWFSDVWTKESLANFLSDKMAADYFGDDFDAVERQMLHMQKFATSPMLPVARTLDNMNNAMEMYGPLSYHKGTIILQLLEQEIGESAFRSAFQDIIEKYSFGNYSWEEMLNIFRIHAPEFDFNSFNEKYITNYVKL